MISIFANNLQVLSTLGASSKYHSCAHISLLVCVLVCVFICVFVCILVCMLVCLYVCLYVALFVCLYVCLYVCLFVCLYVCLHVCLVRAATSYHVSVKTGSERGAGTDANVFLKIFGEKGDTGT